MSRFKTAKITPDYSAGIVGRRQGSRVRFWDPATATLSKWTTDPSRAVSEAPADSPAPTGRATAATLGRLLVSELRTLAGDRGIKVPSKARKADLIAALTN